MAPHASATADPSLATAAFLARWYGPRAERFVLDMRQARAAADDRPGAAAWQGVLDALHGIGGPERRET